MYNIRLALAFLFPGFIPTILLLYINGRAENSILLKDLTLYILGSIASGVFIDLLRHRFEKYFIDFFGLTRIKRVFQKGIKKIFKKEIKIIDLEAANLDYEIKEKAVIKFWIQCQLDKNETITSKINADNILKKEYYNPTITAGDRWALLNIVSGNTMDFFLKEYFTYYQFSFNCLIAFIISFILNAIFFFMNSITGHQFLIISGICVIFLWLLHERTGHWLLSCRRYARKIILYSIIKNKEGS